jgi:hypothetical protein
MPGVLFGKVLMKNVRLQCRREDIIIGIGDPTGPRN